MFGGSSAIRVFRTMQRYGKKRGTQGICGEIIRKFAKNKRTMEEKKLAITDESMIALSLDVLKLYHEKVQKRLDYYSQQAKDTTERGYKLIGFYICLLTIGTGYLYTHWNHDAASWAILVITLGTMVATIFMLKIIFPRLAISVGRSLEELRPNEYAQSFQKANTGSRLQMKCVLQDEINMLQVGIEIQRKSNRRRTSYFKWSLISISAGLVLSVVIFFASVFALGYFGV